jgi:hypothetical protein
MKHAIIGSCGILGIQATEILPTGTPAMDIVKLLTQLAVTVITLIQLLNKKKEA